MLLHHLHHCRLRFPQPANRKHPFILYHTNKWTNSIIIITIVTIIIVPTNSNSTLIKDPQIRRSSTCSTLQKGPLIVLNQGTAVIWNNLVGEGILDPAGNRRDLTVVFIQICMLHLLAKRIWKHKHGFMRNVASNLRASRPSNALMPYKNSKRNKENYTNLSSHCFSNDDYSIIGTKFNHLIVKSPMNTSYIHHHLFVRQTMYLWLQQSEQFENNMNRW